MQAKLRFVQTGRTTQQQTKAAKYNLPLIRVIYPEKDDCGVAMKVCALAQITCSIIPTWFILGGVPSLDARAC